MGKDEQGQKARVTPRGGATRCPFCHDECDPATDVVVCRECLSRHHEGCWREGGSACSTCSATEALTPEGAEREAKTFEKPAPLAILLASEGILFYGVFGLIVPAFKTMFEETGIMLPELTKLLLTFAAYPLLTSLGITGLFAIAARFKVDGTAGVAGRLTILNAALIGFVVLGLFLPLIELIEKL